ncbi:MAG TPA: DUF6531 domain-containing protein, partial [Nocardioides sp.]
MVRRVAVLVVASLVASLGVLVGSEAVVPPAPAAALPPVGLSTLAGTGTQGDVDGPASTAQFDFPLDVAVSPDGSWLYVLDEGDDGRPNRIRKVSTTTGAVSTFTSGGVLASDPGRLEVDPAGNVWVSIAFATQDMRLVRFDASGNPTTMMTGISTTSALAFSFDPAGQNVYVIHSNPNGPYTGRTLNRMPIGSMPQDADQATSLGAPGPGARGGAADYAWSPRGELFISWGSTIGTNGVGLWRYDGTPDLFTLISPWVSQQHRMAFTATGGSLYTVSNDNTEDELLRLGDFGAGPASVLAGGAEGDADGDPGQLSEPHGLVFSPDGRVAYIADTRNAKVRQLLVPPDPWELSPDQLCGPCNRGQKQLQVPKVVDPVDVATGNLSESVTDLVLPGRGPVASVSRTYNSHFFDKVGLFGPGWSSPLDAHLEEASGTVTIYQENGASLPFARLTDDSLVAAPRVTSTLEELPGGGWRLDRNYGDIVTFDAAGRVSGWEDRNGYVTTVARPSASQIVMTTPGGRSLTLAVASGRITSVSDDSSPVRTVDYAYTGTHLTTVETFKVNAADAGRVTWTYGYDTAGRLNTITDPRGSSNLTHYDSQGRVDYQLDYAGARSDIAYGGSYPDEWREVTAPAYTAGGARAVTRYQLDGLLTKSVTSGYGTASARTISYSYDPDTLGVATVTGPGSVVLGSFTYDDRGNMLTSTGVTGRTSTYAYADSANPNSPTSVTDPDGNTSTLTYDDAGNLETSSVPVRLPGGSLQGTAVTTLQRADAGHPEDVTAVIAPDQYGQPTPKKAEFSYRAGDGQLSWVEDPENNRTTFGYDSRGFVTSTVTPEGNATGTAGDYETTFAVNDFGMVRSVTDPLGEVSSQLFDRNGNINSVTDASNQTSTTTYDAMDRPRIVTRADSSQTETTYFPYGALRAQINGLGAATTYTYDVHGAVLSTTDPNSQTTGYRYDGLGRLQYRIDPGGSCPSANGCTTYGYSPTTSELTSIAYSDPATPDTTAIAYDDLGRRSSATRSAGGGQTWTWDSVGQLRSSTDVNGRTTSYTWTLGGNLASIAYPGQTTPVTYSYDAADRMTSVSDWAGRTTSFAWTPDSQWQTTTFPSGTNNVDTRLYDEAGRLASVEWKRSATSLGKLTYDRSSEGLIESETPTGGTFSTKTWGYDDVDQLDQVDAAALSLDDAGNLTRTEDGTYQVFDPAQQLCWTSPTASGPCGTPAADATVHDYDARGNRTASARPDGTTATYGYDQENRLVSLRDGSERPISSNDGIPRSGDFDGDDIDDIFWTTPNTDDDVMSWGAAPRGAVGRQSTAYEFDFPHTRLVADFDGDGNDDIFHSGVSGITDEVWFWF